MGFNGIQAFLAAFSPSIFDGLGTMHYLSRQLEYDTPKIHSGFADHHPLSPLAKSYDNRHRNTCYLSRNPVDEVLAMPRDASFSNFWNLPMSIPSQA